MNWGNPFQSQLGSLQNVQFPPPPSEFVNFQRIRLKHIKEMLEQCDKRPDEVVAPAVAVLMAEKKAIEEFLGETS